MGHGMRPKKVKKLHLILFLTTQTVEPGKRIDFEILTGMKKKVSVS